MRNSYLLALLLLAAVACKSKKPVPSTGTPACILKETGTFATTACEKGATVKEYTFQSKRVFVFDRGSCGADMTQEVFDENCKNIGSLGGFTGNVKINNEDFSHAVYVRTSWQKN